MSTIERPIAQPRVDEDGFLVEGEKWTRDIAEILAGEDKQPELTEDHWRIINYLRQYYLELKSVPPVRKLARDTGTSLRYLNQLFPEGLTKSACRIAGIPRATIRPSFNYP